MPANTFNVPQSLSSRAAYAEPPSSDSTVREDIDMQASDQAGDIAADGDDAIERFGQRSRDLIQGIRNLESIGIDATLSSLPKFVVVGDQSHGKSSIIEAICGISLPRSAGTCTRCPFRITTTAARPGERWKCEIALSRRWASTSTGAHWRDTGDTRAFPFATVTDRTQLEHVLRRAQIAILNPHLDPAAVLQLSGFDTDTTTHLQSLSFSVNPIELYISGEELPELSITDLPGSINVAPDESEQHLVGLVEKLIKEHVNDEKALILLVASMDQDLETSTAFRFVGNCKALARSVGVLTKPDLLNRSRVEHVSRILSGKVFKLGNGWFVTKNLSQEELDRSMTHTEARDLEKRFFEGDPWSSSLANHQASFGTRQLQDTISSLLVSHIERELPDIVERVKARLACVSSQLDAMPERPVSPSQTVMEEVQKLTTMATKYTTGDDDAFRAKFKSHMRSYAKALQAARPKLRLGTPGYEKQVIPLDSDEDVASDTPTPSKKRKNNGGYATSPAPRAGVPRPTPRSTPRPTRFKQEEQPATQARAELTLDKIHKAIDRASTSDLPDQVHPKVTERLILDSTSMWPALTTDLLDNIQSLVGKMLAKCVADTLGARGCTQLFTETGRIIDAFCKNVFEDETRFINHLVAGETHRPTSYGDALKQSTQRMKTELAAARLKERLDEHFDTLEVEHNAKVTLPEKRMEKAKDSDFVAKHLGPDKYAREVAAMGMPFAYYDLASSRMVDTVASFLERGVVYTVETKLQARLHMDLRARDDAHCAELLAEDPEREIQRQRLIAEKARLEEALKELEGLPGQH